MLPRTVRRARTFFVYILLLHIIRTICDLVLPNWHVANLIRGRMMAPFFAACGQRVAIASGCTFNGAWNLTLGDNVYIAHNCWINASGGLTLETGVILSPNVVVTTTAHRRVRGAVSLRESDSSPVCIGAGTWVASNTVVTRGSAIGRGVVVGAGSVVIGKLPDNSFCVGSPARAVKELVDEASAPVSEGA